MTVSELIEKLQSMNPDLPVFARGYEDGYDPSIDVKTVVVINNRNPQWYNGKVDLYIMDKDFNEEHTVGDPYDAVILFN